MSTAPKSRSTRPVDYPTSDGKPMAETDLHRQDMVDVIETLQDFFAGDPQVYVTGNLLLLYEEGNRRKHVAPDVFVVRGVPKLPPEIITCSGRRRRARRWSSRSLRRPRDARIRRRNGHFTGRCCGCPSTFNSTRRKTTSSRRSRDTGWCMGIISRSPWWPADSRARSSACTWSATGRRCASTIRRRRPDCRLARGARGEQPATRRYRPATRTEKRGEQTPPSRARGSSPELGDSPVNPSG